MTASATHRRRASVYVVVLGFAMIVTIVGVSAMLAVRVRQRCVQGGNDFTAARFYAQSAIDLGFYTLETYSDWRDVQPNGTWIVQQSFGRGSMTLQGLDPGDGDLSDSDGDSLVLIGSGTCGQSHYQLQVTLVPPFEPLEALNTCLHAADDIVVDWGVTVTVTDAPLSSNADLWNSGFITGDVEVDQCHTFSEIDGEVTESAPPKDLPDPDVFDQYVALATPIAFPGAIAGALLSPGTNPWGDTNPDGVYFIDTGGSDLWIQGMRLEGTLLVRTHGATLHVGSEVLFDPARADYPVLIVDGNLHVGLDSENPLEESEWGVNFNPPEAPYEGVSDTDFDDQYPSELHGLVHVTGDLGFMVYSKLHGVAICEGQVDCSDDLEITHDPDLASNPPLHYSSYGVPEVSPGSWQRTFP